MIHEKDKIEIPRIRATLKWYCSFLVRGGDLTRSNPQKVHIAYSGEAFRRKFFDLEAARGRLSDERDQARAAAKPQPNQFLKGERRDKLRALKRAAFPKGRAGEDAYLRYKFDLKDGDRAEHLERYRAEYAAQKGTK